MQNFRNCVDKELVAFSLHANKKLAEIAMFYATSRKFRIKYFLFQQLQFYWSMFFQWMKTN